MPWNQEKRDVAYKYTLEPHHHPEKGRGWLWRVYIAPQESCRGCRDELNRQRVSWHLILYCMSTMQTPDWAKLEKTRNQRAFPVPLIRIHCGFSVQNHNFSCFTWEGRQKNQAQMGKLVQSQTRGRRPSSASTMEGQAAYGGNARTKNKEKHLRARTGTNLMGKPKVFTALGIAPCWTSNSRNWRWIASLQKH